MHEPAGAGCPTAHVPLRSLCAGRAVPLSEVSGPPFSGWGTRSGGLHGGRGLPHGRSHRSFGPAEPVTLARWAPLQGSRPGRLYRRGQLLRDTVAHGRKLSRTAVTMCRAHLPWGVVSRSPPRAVPGQRCTETAERLAAQVNDTGARRVPWQGPATATASACARQPSGQNASAGSASVNTRAAGTRVHSGSQLGPSRTKRSLSAPVQTVTAQPFHGQKPQKPPKHGRCRRLPLCDCNPTLRSRQTVRQ